MISSLSRSGGGGEEIMGSEKGEAKSEALSVFPSQSN